MWIEHLNFLNEKNVLEEIVIRKIKIIGCEDHLDNETDSFIAYIYGEMIDYSISGLTGRIGQNAGKKKKKFRDLYYFLRHQDIWLIDRIENEVGIKSVFNAKHILE